MDSFDLDKYTADTRRKIDELKRLLDDPSTSESDREDIRDAIASIGLAFQFTKFFTED